MRPLTLLLAALLCLLDAGPGLCQYRPHYRTALEKRADLRAWAYSQVQVREIGKTNRGKEVDGYQLGAGRWALGSYWCSWFVSAGFRATGIVTAYFGKARSWADPAHIILDHGRPVPGRPAPQPYDLVCYEWGHPYVVHVGFIDIWGQTPACQTVEGNTGGGKLSRDGDGVFKNWRLKSQVAYVVNVVDRPVYTHQE